MSKNIRSPQVRARRKAKNRTGRKRFESKSEIIASRAKNSRKQKILKEKILKGELDTTDFREPATKILIDNVQTAHEILEKLWLEDMGQALGYIKKHAKYPINDEQTNDLFTDSMFRLDEKFLKTRKVVRHESAKKILYGIIKIELKKFNWNAMLENMDRAAINNRIDGEEYLTEEEWVSAKQSDVELLPPSHYFFKKYRHEQYLKHKKKYIDPDPKSYYYNLYHKTIKEYRKRPEVWEKIKNAQSKYRRESEHYKEWRKKWSKEWWEKTRPDRLAYSKQYYYKNHSKMLQYSKQKQVKYKNKISQHNKNKYAELKKDPIKYREHLDKLNERKKRIRREKKLGIYKDRRKYENFGIAKINDLKLKEDRQNPKYIAPKPAVYIAPQCIWCRNRRKELIDGAYCSNKCKETRNYLLTHFQLGQHHI